ncbi:hypothetical protein [Rhizobium sp. 2MFCol3.1]|uniref:hypothetical protein n=1 Tax=Rhizobium sp. 2MFCol3.1 TaxID=1246459 RepID=UPI0003784FB1|nr:hypothetical protein [Rhizobium sp. 2MFCol3.1]
MTKKPTRPPIGANSRQWIEFFLHSIEHLNEEVEAFTADARLNVYPGKIVRMDSSENVGLIPPSQGGNS